MKTTTLSDRPFNPARFNDQIDEALYAGAWGPGARLKNVVGWAASSSPHWPWVRPYSKQLPVRTTSRQDGI